MSSTDDGHAIASESIPRSSMDTDDDSHTVAQNIISPGPAVASASLSPRLRADPTFMQNQISLKRDPSAAKFHKSSLSRQLSAKSNGNYDAGLSHSGILNVLACADSQTDRGREDSASSVTESVNSCSLSKSSSTSTTNSVRSIPALGTHPFGSLRVRDETEQEDLSPECLSSGDVIVVTGMPAGSIFGIDTLSFTLGNDGHFEGVRDLPSGPHFVYGGSSSELSIRNGFWIMSKHRASGERGEIFVKRWDSYNEILEDEFSVAEVRIQKENAPKIFNSLIPYTTRAIVSRISTDTSREPRSPTTDAGIKDPRIWRRLTFAIKGAMLTRLTGQAWNKWQVSSTHDCKPMEVKPTDAKTTTLLHLASDRAKQMIGKDQILTFVFPRGGVTYSNEVIGRARTEQAMDTSAHIVAVIRDRCTYEDADEVIGELQCCYITGILLGNMACQEQWAHVIKVVFKAFRLAMDMPIFFRKIIETVHAQLIYDEEGVEGSIFDHDVYLQDELKIILTIFKSRLSEQLLAKGAVLTDEQSDVGKAFEALESWLWKWGWDLRGNYLRSGKIQLEDGEYVDAELKEFEAEDERGEYAPVVVDLEDDGREKGLIRW